MKDDYPLRIVPAAELHADALIEQSEVDAAANGDQATPEGSTPIDDSKNNRNIVDDPASQKLTMEEIEALKGNSTGAGRDIISQILQSHTAIDQKTAFSLAKYTLRKNKKYLRRFSIVPLDVPLLAEWMLTERDAVRIMELRNETISLLTSWANVHHDGSNPGSTDYISPGRWLVVDDTSGLMVAAVAEKLGILHLPESESEPQDSEAPNDENVPPEDSPESKPKRKRHHQIAQMSSSTNSITVVHSASQPNLSLLKFFNYDPNDPSSNHPLYTNLKTLSWLQLLSPETDPTYHEPPYFLPSEVSTWKSSKRSAYWRKRRRWERVSSVINTTRAGGFTGLLIASWTSPISILNHLVPLLAGSAQVVIYAPHIEPLVELADVYSTSRRTAYINQRQETAITTPEETENDVATPPRSFTPTPDFPVDPTLLLGSTVQTARIRRWQTLPGRTHPLMMGRGGAEGYVFHATKVIPAEGRVEARGKVSKRRKVVPGEEGKDGNEVKPESQT
ncbi:putative trna (adenine-n)-methyltransferase non-catalytic subunit trm6 [Phaeomoniella chlamydospora]|uniref:tRNA (adenine(58)-N(1))-methyltransferase non-catalytic subunit TRM6 n=1 Tax=Phaeomoniella chlamydospora TaxID=158046 RepID=A0A0G2GG75_PHACM|nr:putative trna (adenine-n)-methyltransferase non-catalytic subunit trm6 [Phaeomoniella chlamydospora]